MGGESKHGGGSGSLLHKSYPSRPKFLVLEQCMRVAGHVLLERREAHVVKYGGKHTIKLLAKITRTIDDRVITTKIKKEGTGEDRSEVTDLNDSAREKFYKDWEIMWIPSLPEDEPTTPTMLIVATLEPFNINYPERSKGLGAGSKTAGSRRMSNRSETFSSSRRLAPANISKTHQGTSAGARSVRPVPSVGSQKGTAEGASRAKAVEAEGNKYIPKVVKSPADLAELGSQNTSDRCRKDEVRENSQLARKSQTKSMIKAYMSSQSRKSSANKPNDVQPKGLEKTISSGGGLKVDELTRLIREQISKSNEELISQFNLALKENEEKQNARLSDLERSIHVEIKALQGKANGNGAEIGAEGGGRRSSCVCARYNLFGSSHDCPHGKLPEFSRTSGGGFGVPPLPTRLSHFGDKDQLSWLFDPPRSCTEQ